MDTSVAIDLSDDHDKSVAHRRKVVERPIADLVEEDSVSIKETILDMIRDRGSRSSLLLALLLVGFALLELFYSKWANSLALVSSAFFDMVDAVVLLVGVWGRCVQRRYGCTSSHSYGHERYEVVVRFGVASYFLFVCLWVFLEGIERMLEVEPTFIHGAYLVRIGCIGLVLQVIHVLAFRRLSLVSRSGSAVLFASSSSLFSLAWEFLADACIVVCGLLISHRGYFILDTMVALLLTTIIAWLMLPVSRKTALLLMQAVPPHIPAARIVREVSTLDGVLEVTREHFWSLGNTDGSVGTLRVRVRREVDEQTLLAKIADVCAPFLKDLTIQLDKDDWDKISIKH